MKQKLPFLVIGTLCLVYVLHIVAIVLRLYWTSWWFDEIVHALAGFSVGLSYLMFRSYFSWLEKSVGAGTALILGVFIVGVSWEVFEWYAGLASVHIEGYWLDTSMDVIADMLGGIAAYKYFKKHDINS